MLNRSGLSPRWTALSKRDTAPRTLRNPAAASSAAPNSPNKSTANCRQRPPSTHSAVQAPSARTHTCSALQGPEKQLRLLHDQAPGDHVVQRLFLFCKRDHDESNKNDFPKIAARCAGKTDAPS